MKKTISLLLLAAVVTFGACRKSGCWKCTTTQTNNEGPLFSGAAAKFTECDKTEAEIRLLEQERSGTQTHTSNGVTHTSTATTTCK